MAGVFEVRSVNGLLLLTCGVSSIRFMPPLLISRRQVDEAIALVETSLIEAIAGQTTRREIHA